jgi:putative transposase
MPRRPRVLIEGGLYHVYNRFARGEGVLGDPEEAIGFVELLLRAKQRDDLVVFAWCVMSNHYHIAVRCSAVPLSRTMQFLQGRFSRDFNRRWKRTGPLWQGRYKARLVDEPGYLPSLIKYIHLNPVRAGVVEDPTRYTFSGHRELMGKVRAGVCNVEEALLSFGPTLKTARRSYSRALKLAMNEDDVGEEMAKLPWWTFDRDLKLEDGRAHVDILGRSTGLERPRLDADEFVTMAGDVLGVDVDQLASSRQDTATAKLRRIVASCGIERWGQRAGEMAKVLRKHPVVVSRWVSEGRQMRDEDGKFSAALEKLDSALSETAMDRLRNPERAEKKNGSGRRTTNRSKQ